MKSGGWSGDYAKLHILVGVFCVLTIASFFWVLLITSEYSDSRTRRTEPKKKTAQTVETFKKSGGASDEQLCEVVLIEPEYKYEYVAQSTDIIKFKAIESLRTQGIVDELLKFMSDPSPVVKKKVIFELTRLQNKVTSTELIRRATENEEKDVKEFAEFYLAQLSAGNAPEPSGKGGNHEKK